MGDRLMVRLSDPLSQVLAGIENVESMTDTSTLLLEFGLDLGQQQRRGQLPKTAKTTSRKNRNRERLLQRVRPVRGAMAAKPDTGEADCKGGSR